MLREKDNVEISVLLQEDKTIEAIIRRAELLAENLNLKLLGIHQIYKGVDRSKDDRSKQKARG